MSFKTILRIYGNNKYYYLLQAKLTPSTKLTYVSQTSRTCLELTGLAQPGNWRLVTLILTSSNLSTQIMPRNKQLSCLDCGCRHRGIRQIDFTICIKGLYKVNEIVYKKQKLLLKCEYIKFLYVTYISLSNINQSLGYYTIKTGSCEGLQQISDFLSQNVFLYRQMVTLSRRDCVRSVGMTS